MRSISEHSSLGAWFSPVLKTLARLRFVRGTPLDIFGYGAMRREERRLIGWYVDLLQQALGNLNAGNRDAVLEIAELPDDIRGYEEIKLKSLVQVRERAAAQMAALAAGKSARQAA
jgi:indolepyruvate ferredoxin oxidoreductase